MFSDYLKLGIKLISRSIKEFKIQNFFVRNRHLELIINSGSHLKTLGFYNCEIDLANMKLYSVKSYSIERLNFLSGTAESCKWDKEPEKFFPLLEAISTSNLKESLKILDLYKNGKHKHEAIA